MRQSSQLVCFKLGKEEFGVDILKVREILRLQKIAKVPQTDKTVAGVINLRGNVIPVIDLRKKLNLESIEKDDKNRIIVFNIADKLIGMIVDRVERVIRLRQDQIEPPPDIGVGQIEAYITGVGKLDKSLIILLNIDKILTDEEIIRIDELKKVKQAVTKQVQTKKVERDKKQTGARGKTTKKTPPGSNKAPSKTKKTKE